MDIPSIFASRNATTTYGCCPYRTGGDGKVDCRSNVRLVTGRGGTVGDGKAATQKLLFIFILTKH